MRLMTRLCIFACRLNSGTGATEMGRWSKINSETSSHKSIGLAEMILPRTIRPNYSIEHKHIDNACASITPHRRCLSRQDLGLQICTLRSMSD